MKYVARFAGVKGRWLVEDEGGVYGGQKILDRRQLKYRHAPDAETGLFLDESYRVFGKAEVAGIAPFVKKA